MSQQEDLVALGKRLLLGNYSQAPVVMTRGEGCALWDVSGRRYLDMTAGVAVCVLGHGDPGLADAIGDLAITGLFKPGPRQREPVSLSTLAGKWEAF